MVFGLWSSIIIESDDLGLSTGPFLDLGLGLWTGTWTRACQYDSMYTESGQFGHLLQKQQDEVFWAPTV